MTKSGEMKIAVRNENPPRSQQKCALHPLIHTFLLFNPLQHIVPCKRLLLRCFTGPIAHCSTSPTCTAMVFKKWCAIIRGASGMDTSSRGGATGWSQIRAYGEFFLGAGAVAARIGWIEVGRLSVRFAGVS